MNLFIFSDTAVTALSTNNAQFSLYFIELVLWLFKSYWGYFGLAIEGSLSEMEWDTHQCASWSPFIPAISPNVQSRRASDPFQLQFYP